MKDDWKKERKRKQERDRTKYKKTDHKKWEAKQRLKSEQKLSNKNLVCGRVLAIHSNATIVEYRHDTFVCTMRGLFKKEITTRSNLIAVGDFVLFSKESKQIAHINERKSILSRVKGPKEQLLAANIDQVLITTSVVKPPLKPALVDRYIIATRKGNMEPVIVVNKIDLLEKGSEDAKNYRNFVKVYRALGYKVVCVSTLTNKGIPTLKKVMKSKASVFSGQSGVGKSSLINTIADLSIPIGDMIEKTHKGTHTTTRTNLIPLDFGGFCIDTPGIRSFGVWNLKREDLAHNFPEICGTSQNCKFPNCTHTHEPKCAVKKSVEKGTIALVRFESYLKLLTEV